MHQYTKTIQNICEARGELDIYAQAIMNILKKDYYEQNTIDRWLRGFLMEPETLKVWWGEEINDTAIEQEHWIPNWQYHSQQLIGLSIEAMLKYFEEHTRL